MHPAAELRLHPVGSLEELTGKGHHFPVGRMVQRLDTCHSGRRTRLLILQISGQLLLRAGGPGNEDRPRVRETLGHLLQERLIEWCEPAVAGIRLVVDMLVRMAAPND